MSLLKLEEEAIHIAREIAIDGSPTDAGAIGKLANVVRDAHQEGYDKAVREVVDAYRLFIDTDDLDGFRDTITDMMPDEDRPVSQETDHELSRRRELGADDESPEEG